MPPVRDDESETQRKAHAKLVRQTRRSTQGVTLEDLKSAEKLVKSRNNESSQYQVRCFFCWTSSKVETDTNILDLRTEYRTKLGWFFWF